jgi:hypothetical protein
MFLHLQYTVCSETNVRKGEELNQICTIMLIIYSVNPCLPITVEHLYHIFHRLLKSETSITLYAVQAFSDRTQDNL